MKRLYLINEETYTFNLYTKDFQDQTVYLVDENGDEITLGVTETWVYSGGSVYTGDREKKKGVWYAKNTNRVIHKIKIEFTPENNYNISNNIAFIRDEESGLDRVRLEVAASYTKLENPDIERFSLVFNYDKTFDPDPLMKKFLINNVLPAGLITKEVDINE